jgi:hypothetical protein
MAVAWPNSAGMRGDSTVEYSSELEELCAWCIILTVEYLDSGRTIRRLLDFSEVLVNH